MKTVGIIAEYNPFHNGHAYQINQLKKQGAEQIVVIMSGNFVQRGMPAFCDKYLRTQMALECGADFVFELPAVFATASAETFAMGGVSMLNGLGFVDGICFGSECGDISLLQHIADTSLSLDAAETLSIPINTSNNSTDSDKSTGNLIQSLISRGLSYPQAQAKVLTDTILKYPKAKNNTCISSKDIEKLISSPNNILAIEYLKAIKRLNSHLIPHTITRIGAGYHDKPDCTINNQNTSAKNTDINKYHSAAGIRDTYTSSLLNGQNTDALNSIKFMMPDKCIKLLQEHPKQIMSDTTALSKMLYYKLRYVFLHGKFSDYSDVSFELEKRIIRFLPDYENFESFAMKLKTKHYTYTRICRCLLHILLDIRSEDITRFMPELPLSIRQKKEKSLYKPSSMITPYTRLLGFNRQKSSLLRDTEGIKIVTKTADATKLLESETALWLWEKDMFAADIFRQCFNTSDNKLIPDEYRSGVVIV